MPNQPSQITQQPSKNINHRYNLRKRQIKEKEKETNEKSANMVPLTHSKGEYNSSSFSTGLDKHVSQYNSNNSNNKGIDNPIFGRNSQSSAISSSSGIGGSSHDKNLTIADQPSKSKFNSIGLSDGEEDIDHDDAEDNTALITHTTAKKSRRDSGVLVFRL